MVLYKLLLLFVIAEHCFPIFPVFGILMDQKSPFYFPTLHKGTTFSSPPTIAVYQTSSVQKF